MLSFVQRCLIHLGGEERGWSGFMSRCLVFQGSGEGADQFGLAPALSIDKVT